MRSEELAPFLQDEFYTQGAVATFSDKIRISFARRRHSSRQLQLGQTVFIEPRKFINTNNDLKMAEMEIENEARRILRELSKRSATSHPS